MGFSGYIRPFIERLGEKAFSKPIWYSLAMRIKPFIDQFSAILKSKISFSKVQKV